MRENLSEKIIESLKYLRRYARALLGSQEAGDTYVRLCLEALLQQQESAASWRNIKLELFMLFHDVLRRLDTRIELNPHESGSLLTDFSVRSRLDALSTPERQVLLLTTLERFSLAEAATILDITEKQAADLLSIAWASVRDQLSTSVLVIEDDPVIAADVSRIVSEMGHTVIGMAADQREATALAKQNRPGLILADIDLGTGGSGLAAALEITRTSEVPVVFVTGHPEQLLTGERPEPTYLVTKPFDQEILHVTISQALSLSRAGGGELELRPAGTHDA